MQLLSTLLTATAILGTTQASPFLDVAAGYARGLKARDLHTNYCVDFVYGFTNTKLGKLCVSISNTHVTITYPTLSGDGQTYTDLHAYVSSDPITDPAQAKWPLTLGHGQCKTEHEGRDASCSTPVTDAYRVCGKTLYIAAHASFGTETGWGNGACIPGGRPQNCAKTFPVTVECRCDVVTTYAPYSTEVEYVVTKVVYETSTKTCETTKAPVTATATCANPAAGATETVDGGYATPEGYTCAAPTSDFVCPH
ncbi:hypothetical protein BDW02DRAFT_583852 [Decorospora gaudefroyi]|uniref:Uncharacterized protein n=1 Tax=Decorospora gaudefroyi TaxID=184978 RepID=A0A6A5JYJ3_9PLEO|nr:hypothetical protein BDW02DRAFT_583852 [Decorospora gaudefroyi]